MNHPYISSLSISFSSTESISLPYLTPGLNVIYGRNEAGKSRIRDFIEWMLFASSEEIALLKPAATKKVFAHLESNLSGTATFSIDGSQITLTQKLVNGITQTNIDSTRITSQDLSRIMTDGISRTHYNNIFSLSLDELSRAESNKLITETEMMNLFFGATASGAGVSPTTLLNALSASKDSLFSEAKQAKNLSINRVLKALSENTSLIKQLRTEERNLDTIDADIDKLTSDYEIQLQEIETLTKEIEHKTRIIEYAQDFLSYQHLNGSEKPTINSRLISHNVEIKMLIEMCKQLIDQGDESENERIQTVIKSLQDEHDQQNIELSITLDPDTVSPSIRSPHLASVIEAEDRSINIYNQEIGRLNNSITQYTADLGLLTQEAEQLQNNIAQTQDMQTQGRSADDSTISETKGYTSSKLRHSLPIVIGVAALCSFVIATGFLISQPFAGIAGITALIGWLIYSFTNTSKKIATHELDDSSTSQFLIKQFEQDLYKTTSKIENFEDRIGALLNDISILESKREDTRQEYNKTITSVGFEKDTPPHLVSLYLDAYQTYYNRAQRINEYLHTLVATQKRMTKLFDRANKLRSIATGTQCETNESFTRLSDVRTWATALYDLSQEQIHHEENLHKTEEEIQQLEKTLNTNFESIENAHQIYSHISVEDIIKELDSLREELEVKREELRNTDHGIVLKTQERDNAGKSTAIADAMQYQQQLTDEIRALHAAYCARFVAHSSVSQALEIYLEKNQPELLRVASHMLEMITLGEWNKVSVSQNENSKSIEPLVYVSGSRAPHGLSVSQLSRGTREQLYLCLRLALMSTSTRGIGIPALFDDIAVNSDRSRMESLAPVISEVAQQRQIIYFTCHELTRDILVDEALAHNVSL